MKSENKICQNCHNDFTIEPDDFTFYEKIKVPPPTFCPECRIIRKLAWRNSRSLYKRPCGLCGKSIIGMYPDTNSAPVYCEECWPSDNWDRLSYGKNFDFSKDFFTQIKELWNVVPRFYSFRTGTLINSPYTNYSKDNKNVYLSYSITESEDTMYSENSDFAKNCLDNFSVKRVDWCSFNVNCEGNYNTHYAVKSNNCMDSFFIFDCSNCSNCCLSYNLRNKKYFFRNKQLSKDEYLKEIKNLESETYTGLSKAKIDFKNLIQEEAIHRYAYVYHSEKISGDYVINSKNIKYSFNVYDSDNVSFCIRILGVKDCWDCHGSGFGSELIYDSVVASLKSLNCHFCYICLGCRDCEYSLICRNCSNCFGCVSLINAQYCIFNKQYKKEEYFEMIEKIKKHMIINPYVDNKGRIYKYGEFFPFDMSPFGYNETEGNSFFNISKEEAFEKGYNWKDNNKRDYTITIKSEDLPNNIKEVTDSILDETISCPNEGSQKYLCTMAYRIMPEELRFYKQKGLPLPRYCPNCRHYQRIEDYYNSIKLWHRKCMHEGCANEFETSYAPDRPEIVYCESCYQKEVC